MGKSFTDPAYRDTVTVVKEARNILALPKGAGRELVALYITVHEGSRYTGGAQQNSFTIDADGSTAGNHMSQTYNSVASSAGLKPLLPAAPPSAGHTSMGWTVFTVTPGGAKSLTFVYQRAAANVMGGKTIPAASFKLPLPS